MACSQVQLERTIAMLKFCIYVHNITFVTCVLYIFSFLEEKLILKQTIKYIYKTIIEKYMLCVDIVHFLQ